LEFRLWLLLPVQKADCNRVRSPVTNTTAKRPRLKPELNYVRLESLTWALRKTGIVGKKRFW
jgi:hypothetical protein